MIKASTFYSDTLEIYENKLYIISRMLDSLAACRTMFPFAVSCKTDARWSVTPIDFISNK